MELTELAEEGFKYIARDLDGDLYAFHEKPEKREEVWLLFGIHRLVDKPGLDYIKWEDEEPHSIAELIEEYESEETEVKKDIEWLYKSIVELPARHLGFSVLKDEEEFGVPKDDVLELINQLDEPEVLSKNWIDKHTYYEEEYDFYYADPDELKNLLVPKQEKIKIPKSWHDIIIQNKEEGHSLRWVLNYIDNLPVSNVDKFARAWLDGYTVEEPKFVIDLDDEEISDGNHYLKRLEMSANGVNVIVGDSLNVMTFERKEEAQLIADYVGGRVEELEE